MAPIRRYLRITQFSVLECRIYVDDPVLAESWLLNSRNPVLPRVIESVRPLVIPKIREENERGKSKGKKKKGVKDVVVEDDFEVSIFLTETTTRHSLLTKHKHFREKGRKELVSNSQKLTGGDTNEDAIHIEDGVAILREETDEDAPNLQDVPPIEIEGSDSETDSLFVSEDSRPRRSKRTAASPSTSPLPKRRKEGLPTEHEVGTDDKKKMAMDTSYDGFAIYGRVLCLVVKRKDKKGKGSEVLGNTSGQATMENWITSTQMPDDEG